MKMDDIVYWIRGFSTVKQRIIQSFLCILILACTGLLLSSCSDLFGSGTDKTDKTSDEAEIIEIPDTLKLMLGRGYDITGSYASSSEIKNSVLDLDKLKQAAYVKRDPNYRTANFESITGSTIQSYQNSLTTKVSTSASAGIEGLGSFSTEIGASFGMERATNSQYAFATSTSRIVKDAYVIDYRNDPSKLLAYVSEQFASDVLAMTPKQLISNYGTHVMLGGVLGARLDYNMSVKVKKTSSTYSIGAYANAHAEVTIEGISAGGGSSVSVDTEFSEYFETSSRVSDTKVVGGNPELARIVHDKGSYEEWIHSIVGNEIWSDYYPNSLVPITEFIADATKKQAVESYCASYFEGKKIIVSTTTHKDIAAANPVLLFGSAYVMNEGMGDTDIHTGSDAITDWELCVEPKKTMDGRNIKVDFVYTVQERKGDATKLVLRQTQLIMVNKNIVSIDTPESWTSSGTLYGNQSGIAKIIIDATNKVVPSGADSPILGFTLIQVDGSGGDENNIWVLTDVKVAYTYQGD